MVQVSGNSGNNVIDGGGRRCAPWPGATGNDIYVLDCDDGSDTFQENDATAGNTDLRALARASPPASCDFPKVATT